MSNRPRDLVLTMTSDRWSRDDSRLWSASSTAAQELLEVVKSAWNVKSSEALVYAENER